MSSKVKQSMGSGYMSKSMQKDVSRQMDSMPAHLKQYAGAYMEQQVLRPSYQGASGGAASVNRVATDLPSRPPTPSTIKRDHSLPVGEQFNMDLDLTHGYATAAQRAHYHSSSQTQTQQNFSGSEPPPANSNPYEFITSPAQPPKKNIFSLSGGSSMKKRVLVVLGGGVVLMILILLLSSFLGGGGTTGLLSIAQQQNELVRVATEAGPVSTQQTTQNLAINIQLALTTNQQQLTSYMAKHGQKVSTKQLALTKSNSTDEQLKTAQSVSNYDPVYLQITQNGLTQYMQNLKTVFQSASGQTERQLLSAQYKSAGILLDQTKSAQVALQGT